MILLFRKLMLKNNSKIIYKNYYLESFILEEITF